MRDFSNNSFCRRVSFSSSIISEWVSCPISNLLTSNLVLATLFFYSYNLPSNSFIFSFSSSMNPRSVSAWPVIFSIRYYNCSTLFIFCINSSLSSAYSLSFRCRTDIFSSDWMSRCLSLSISYRSSDSRRWHSYSGMKAWVLLGSLVLYLFLCSYIFFKLLSFFNFSSKKQTFFSNAISFAVEFCCPFSSSSNLYFPPNIW